MFLPKNVLLRVTPTTTRISTGSKGTYNTIYTQLIYTVYRVFNSKFVEQILVNRCIQQQDSKSAPIQDYRR